MNKPTNLLLILFSVCFVGLGFYSPKAFSAQSISDLVNQEKLRVTISLPKESTQIVNQAFIVSIDVATDRWFETGSQIQPFALPSTVMQANNIETINGSERIQGKTWAIQTHEITLFPSKAGTYILPEININVSINTEHNGVVTGVFTTQQSSFVITLPDELKNIEHFIVSSNVTIDIDSGFNDSNSSPLNSSENSSNKNKPSDYLIGDAVTQTLTITANDIPAMMIPEISTLTAPSASTDDLAELEGVSIYHKPSQIFDKSNRGTSEATRIESSTYIFEKPGEYSLPEKTLYWWNTQSNSLESLTVPSVTWTVKNNGTVNYASVKANLKNFTLNPTRVLLLAILISFVLLVCLGLLKRQFILLHYKKITNYEQRCCRKQILNNIANKNYAQAAQGLYQYATLINKQNEIQQADLTKQLNQLAFDDAQHLKPSNALSINQVKLLIKKIELSTTHLKNDNHFPTESPIKLNRK